MTCLAAAAAVGFVVFGAARDGVVSMFDDHTDAVLHRAEDMTDESLARSDALAAKAEKPVIMDLDSRATASYVYRRIPGTERF
jgi:hypothetical protein